MFASSARLPPSSRSDGHDLPSTGGPYGTSEKQEQYCLGSSTCQETVTHPGQRFLLDIPAAPLDTDTNIVPSGPLGNFVVTCRQLQGVVGRLRLAPVPELLHAGYALVICLSEAALSIS